MKEFVKPNGRVPGGLPSVNDVVGHFVGDCLAAIVGEKISELVGDGTANELGNRVNISRLCSPDTSICGGRAISRNDVSEPSCGSDP